MRFNKYLLGLLFPLSAHAASIDMNYGAGCTAYKIGSDTKIPVTASSTVVTFTNDARSLVYRFEATVDTHINLNGAGATSPTATLSNTLIVAGVPEYFAVEKNTNIAITRDAADGNLYIGKTAP